MIAAWPCPGSDAGSGEEYAVAFDRQRETRLLVIPALFDEANKLRRFTVETMRRLDAAGIDSFLPDLPGWNESLSPLEEQTLEGWCHAAQAAARNFVATHVLTLRAGALLAPPALPGWRYAPTNGNSVLRAMLRARVLASREMGVEESRDDLLERGRNEGLELAGYHLGPALLAALAEAEPPESETQTTIAQGEVGGGGLWLRAEPGENAAQANKLAMLIAEGAGVPFPSSDPLSVRGEPVEPPTTRHVRPSKAKPLRHHLTFQCERDTLLGTLDDADGTTGLLVVTGGNEMRAGAFSGQAQFAARVAAAGHPVFRYDRTGVGDSTGTNAGFLDSGRCIAAALATFLVEKPDLRRVVAFGNCDAASALMLYSGAGCHSLVLANPWTFEGEEDDGAPPPAAIRARYLEKLRNPREVLRLVSGKVNLRKLAGGIGRALRHAPPPTPLVEQMRSGLAQFSGPARLLVAERDRTGQAFLSCWDAPDARIARCPQAGHAFAEPHAREWLYEQLISALRVE